AHPAPARPEDPRRADRRRPRRSRMGGRPLQDRQNRDRYSAGDAEVLAAIQVLARGRGVHVGWVNVDVKWLVPVDAAPAVRATPEPSVAAGNGRGETHLPVTVGAAGGPDGNGRIALTG